MSKPIYEDLQRISDAVNVIKSMGKPRFTRTDYENAKHRGMTTVDWLRCYGIIHIVATEQYTTEIRVSCPNRVMVDKYGQTICTEDEYYSSITMHDICKRLGTTWKEAYTKTITGERFIYELADMRTIQESIDKIKKCAITQAKKTIIEYEPRVQKAYAVLALCESL